MNQYVIVFCIIKHDDLVIKM